MKYKGLVQKGSGSGRRLGFPTANIAYDATESGIYAALARFDGEEYDAAAYADTKRTVLEVHVLDFDEDLYGKEMEIELVKKIRDDMPFADEEEARIQIAGDVLAVRAHFNRP